jgi:hypothetical protein
MEPRTKTVALLRSIDALSNNRLTRQTDLGFLIDLAEEHQQHATLDELSFEAKFASKTFGIMQRIGANGQGYDRLSSEFTLSVQKIQNHLHRILAQAPEHERQEFSAVYLSMTHDSFGQLLALCSDLGWYKNWLIDHRDERRH